MRRRRTERLLDLTNLRHLLSAVAFLSERTSMVCSPAIINSPDSVAGVVNNGKE